MEPHREHHARISNLRDRPPTSSADFVNMEDSLETGVIIRAPRAQSYPAAKWTQMKDVVTFLYRDQDKSLTQVKTILAQQHCFYPT